MDANCKHYDLITGYWYICSWRYDDKDPPPCIEQGRGAQKAVFVSECVVVA